MSVAGRDKHTYSETDIQAVINNANTLKTRGGDGGLQVLVFQPLLP
jgi:hypothetical protein